MRKYPDTASVRAQHSTEAALSGLLTSVSPPGQTLQSLPTFFPGSQRQNSNKPDKTSLVALKEEMTEEGSLPSCNSAGGYLECVWGLRARMGRCFPTKEVLAQGLQCPRLFRMSLLDIALGNTAISPAARGSNLYYKLVSLTLL